MDSTKFMTSFVREKIGAFDMLGRDGSDSQLCVCFCKSALNFDDGLVVTIMGTSQTHVNPDLMHFEIAKLREASNACFRRCVQ